MNLPSDTRGSWPAEASRPTALLLVAACLVPTFVVLSEPLAAALGLGPLSHHTVRHIFIMDGLAPLCALALLTYGDDSKVFCPVNSLAWATTAQLVVLWSWHAPPALEWATHSLAAGIAMQATLLLVAMWFWFAVFAQRDAARWRSVFALLVTAKLFCLLGVVLVFAPRTLYTVSTLHTAGATPDLADQQLAGLIMLGACPLTYVGAGIFIAACWLWDLEAAGKTFAVPAVRAAEHSGA